MQYRIVGETGLRLSAIGFGCGGNAGLMLRGEAREQTRIVARALELGINYFDNAPDYGDGLAEMNLGRALKEIGARPLLNSKVEIRAENLGGIESHVVASCEGSLKRLGVEQLDVLQIHNGPSAAPPEMGSRYTQLHMEHFTRRGGAMDGLRRLHRDGKFRFAGFICRGGDGAEVRTLLDSGLFQIINAPFTLINPTAGHEASGLRGVKDYQGCINAAQARGIGAAVYSPLASGFLTDDAVAGLDRNRLARAYDMNSEASARLRKQAAAVSFLARENGITLAQAAFRFVLTHGGVSVALGGFSDLQQLEEIAAAPDMGPFSADAMARLADVWRANFGL